MPNSKVNYNVIGEKLRLARQKEGLDQQELSAALSVDYNIELSNKLIYRIEKGLRPVRDAELIALAKILKVSPDWIFNWKK